MNLPSTRLILPSRLIDIEKWCVSKDKVPLDVYALKKGYEWGASDRRSHSSYVIYKDAVEIGKTHGLPVTLFVDSLQQGIYMIDIEKTCPQEIRQAILLALHDSIIYLERSLSGKGYHLMISLINGVELRTAKYKKWFEILTNHHCTFTDNVVDFNTAYYDDIDTNEFITDDDKDVEFLEKLSSPINALDFYDLVSTSRGIKVYESSSMEAYKQAVSTFDGRHADLFGSLCDMDYYKTVDGDFHGDYSSYEFGYASKLHYLLKRLANDMIDADFKHYKIELNKEQSIMLVYMVLKQMLPAREKHNEMRNGLPWLLYTSQQVYVKTFE